jgi:preprotein translocase subunit SecF
VELFRNTNIDFLGKKWYFLAFSLIFSIAGLCSIFFWHGIPLGVEFRGGTLVYVKFAQTPNLDQIRGELNRAGLHDPKLQRFGPTADNEVLVDLGLQETSEAALDKGKNTIINALEPKQAATSGKLDLNNTGASSLAQYLLNKTRCIWAPTPNSAIP